MHMTSKNKKDCGLPGFAIDPETGKYVPVPYDFSGILSEQKTKRPNQNWDNSKGGLYQQPSKYRKTDYGARKELFKIPSKNHTKAREPTNERKTRPSVGVRKNLLKSLPTTHQESMTFAEKKFKDVPSTRSEAISASLKFEKKAPEKEIYQFQNPVSLNIDSTKNNTDINSEDDRRDNIKTPDTTLTVEEFIKLEKLCQTPAIIITNENDDQQSPVSSVCNMFENNMLLSSPKYNISSDIVSQKDLITEIKNTLEHDRKEYNKNITKIKETLAEMEKSRQENYEKIYSLLGKLVSSEKADHPEKTNSNSDDNEKENQEVSTATRRSLRLQNKTPPPNGASVTSSPVILKAGDLRKSALTKNLISKYQKYNIDSPRIQKALEMYNATRSVCSALLTPKISRNQILESPKSSNWRNNLSLKVQEQCLLLQDTPVHK